MREYPLNKIEISRSKILANARLLKNMHPGISISPVLKSNAFGHGIGLVAPIIESLKFPFLSVSSIEEADALRLAKVSSKIFIMGYVNPRILKERQLEYSLAVFDLEQAQAINKYQKKANVHLHIETGLHREGLDIFRISSLLKEIKKLKSLNIEGIMSHLACSNDPECKVTRLQLENFKKVKRIIKEMGFSPKWFHLGGSLALVHKLESEFNLVRCGKALFGIGLSSAYRSGTKMGIKKTGLIKKFSPTLSVKTIIAQVKKIKKGDHVGYADAFIADSDMTIGILPIGYSDGIDRRLSNKGVMLVGGRQCKILGMVAMNVTTIDVSKVKNPKPGQEVIVFSDRENDPNSFNNAARLAGTLPHEFLIRIPQDMSRVLVP